MEKILESTEEFDVDLFDSIIQAFYNPMDKNHKRAESVLLQFREHPDSWARTAPIISESKDHRSKVFAVQALERAVKIRWSMLTEEQQKGAREYVVDRILEYSMQTSPEGKVLVKQFNQVLIEVIKREWPEKWPTLVGDLMDASKGDCGVCANSFNLLAHLSDSIFNFNESMISERVDALQSQMRNEFPALYEMVLNVLDKVSTGEASVPNDLIVASLNLVVILVPHLPPPYLFGSPLVDVISRYVETEFVVQAIQVLRGVLARREDADDPEEFLSALKRSFVTVGAFFEKYCQMFNDTHSGGFKEHYASFLQKDVNLVRELVLFYGLVYKHAKELEKAACNTMIPLELMLEISKVTCFELFRLCLEFWSMFIKELLLEFPFVPAPSKTPAGLRRSYYMEIMGALVPVLVAQMQRPQEVIITENEDGEIVLEKLADTESIQHHKDMNELLYNISAMTVGGLGPYFCSEINKLRAGKWTRDRLNKVCWAAGSIAGTSSAVGEKEFLTQSIQALLSMCEEAVQEGDRAVVASCLMYILVRNPAYLKTYPLLLEAICNKMVQFILDVDLVGVSEMACDTLLKIMSSCADVLRNPLAAGKDQYITEVIPNIPKLLRVLKPYLAEVLYEALSHLAVDHIGDLLQYPTMCIYTPMLDTPEAVQRMVQAVRLIKVVCSVDICEEFAREREEVVGKTLAQLHLVYNNLAGHASSGSLLLDKAIMILRKDFLSLFCTICRKFSIRFIMGDFLGVCSRVIMQPDSASSGWSVERLNLLAELCGRTVEGVAPLVDSVASCVAQEVFSAPEEKEEELKAFYRMICSSVRTNPDVRNLQIIEWLAVGVGNTNREVYEGCIEALCKVIERTSIDIIREGFLGLLECILGTALDKDHEGGINALLVSLSLLLQYSICGKCPVQAQVTEVFVAKLHGIFPHISQKDIEEFISRCYRDVNSHQGLLTNINDFRVKIKTV
ncbi:exportin-1 [Nematocida major]|uniref:exportin-1 n=1 Tax=Nematocida major TaxID=1912982 RepID=UPI0020084709|nr:exportin-1 [Nematocida major]KAH9385544.1 exportin-1 [Nematocida major]